MHWLTIVATAILPHAVLGSGSLKLDFKVQRNDETANVHRRAIADGTNGFIKRDYLSADFKEVSYMIHIQLGSQKLVVHARLSTQDSDFWFATGQYDCDESISSDSDTDDTIGTCNVTEAYNTEFSSTFKGNISSVPFLLPDYYLTDSGSDSDDDVDDGDWVIDDVVIGNATIKNATFGVSDSSFLTSGYGIFGIGFKQQQGSINSLEYESLLSLMKSQGVIKKEVYSLHVNQDGTLGTILFGAVDHAKYSGNLVTLPVNEVCDDSYDDETAAMWGNCSSGIAVDLVSFDNGSNSTVLTSKVHSAVLALHFESSLFPRDFYSDLCNALNGTSYLGEVKVDCDLVATLSLTFEFGGVKIPVPMSEFIIKSPDFDLSDACFLDVYPLLDYFVLNPQALLHMYLVFDLEASMIGIARPTYSNESQIEVISSSVPTSVTTGGAETKSSKSRAGAGSRSVGLASSLLLMICAAILMLG